MTAFQIEANACTGRGFSGVDANGFCTKFKTWTPKSYASGGPAWTIIDDQSSAGNPYIVVSDQASPTPNSLARIIQVFLPTGTAATLNCFCWFYWNSSTHVGTGQWAVWSINTVDAGTFGYDFRGGPEFMWIASYVAGAVTYGCVETFQSLSTFLESSSVIGTLQNNFFKATGDSGGLLGGYHNITGITYTSGNTDAGFNLYFSIVFVSGTTYFINIYKDSARTSPNLVGHTANFTNSTTGAKAITADNSSGLGGTITTNVTVSANTAISCRFLQVDLNTGAGSLFTVDNYYFLFDASTAGSTLVSYLRVKAISGDTLTLERYTAGKNFLASAVIGAYPHRFFAFYLHRHTSTANGAGLTMPYTSSFGNEYVDLTSNSNTKGGDLHADIGTLGTNLADPQGNIYMQSPLLTEFDNSLNSQMAAPRPYGIAKNLKLTSSSGLSVYTFGRTLAGVNWLDVQHATISGNSFIGLFAGSQFIALCVRDTTSLS